MRLLKSYNREGSTYVFSRYSSGRRLKAVALSVALFATACGQAATEDASSSNAAASDVPVESQAGGPGLPLLVGDTVAGAQFDTNDLAGQDVVVWFWAPW